MGIAEAAGSEVIHYGTTEVLPGVALNMQTIYMSWLTMVIVAAIVFAATRRVQEIPYGIQNLVEMIVEWLENSWMPTWGWKAGGWLHPLS